MFFPSLSPMLQPSHRSSMVILLLSLFIVGGLSVSCHPEPEVKAKAVEVCISFEDFEVTYAEDSAGAGPRQVSDKNASQADVNRISLAVFNSDGELAFSDTRNAETDPENFEHISCMLLPGVYTFVAVAHKASASSDAAAVITSPTEATITTAKLLRTFSCSQDVTILADQSNSVVIDFGSRISSTMQLLTIDDTPEEVVSCELIVHPSASVSQNFTFNPTTGLTSTMYQYKVEQQKADQGGTFKNVILNIHCLLTANPELVNFTVNMKDASGAIVRTRTFSDVELAPHRYTRLKGSFFHSATESSFTFDTDESQVIIPF